MNGVGVKGPDGSDRPEANPSGEEPTERSKPKNKRKSFVIEKRLLVGAWEKVRANYGAPGVDAVSIGLFQERWGDNLYKLWNRMSSGSYFPCPGACGRDTEESRWNKDVRRTVSDRIAQTVGSMYLGTELQPIFHADSYGYRPGRSAVGRGGMLDGRMHLKDIVFT